MALTDANPAFGPTEQGIMLEMSDLLIDSEQFGSIPTHSKNSEPPLSGQMFGPLESSDFRGFRQAPSTSHVHSSISGHPSDLEASKMGV